MYSKISWQAGTFVEAFIDQSSRELYEKDFLDLLT